jgi:hypothetical protein
MEFIPISIVCCISDFGRALPNQTNARRSGEIAFASNADLNLWWCDVRYVPLADKMKEAAYRGDL